MLERAPILQVLKEDWNNRLTFEERDHVFNLIAAYEKYINNLWSMDSVDDYYFRQIDRISDEGVNIHGNLRWPAKKILDLLMATRRYCEEQVGDVR